MEAEVGLGLINRMHDLLAFLTGGAFCDEAVPKNPPQKPSQSNSITSH